MSQTCLVFFSIFCLRISESSAQSEIFELGKLFQTHMDLDFTSFNVFEDGNLEESLNTIFPKYYASIRKEIQEFPSDPQNLLRMKDKWFVKYLLHLNEESTLSALTKISTSPEIIQGNIQPYVLVYWPNPIPDKETALSVLNSDSLKASTRGFSIASQLIFAVNKNSSSESSAGSFMFFEVYSINGFHIVEDIESNGVIEFNCKDCKGPAVRRHNLYGITLNVTGVEDPELNDDLHYETLSNGELTINSEGFSAKVLSILKRSLNFTVKAFRSSDWGRRLQNGTWFGAVKEVADGAADLGIAITIMRPSRASLVSFLPAVDEHQISAFFRPSDLNQIRDIFVRPFHPDLWAAVVSTWIVLAFFMILFSVIRRRYGLNENLEDGVTEPDFINDSFIWALATACQQGWDDHPVAGSLRTIFISGSFTGVVAYAGYSAAIVSTLSLKIDPIKNPTELLGSSLKIGIRKGFLRELLEQNDTNDIITKFQTRVRKLPEDEGYVTAVDGYDKVHQSSYAFISTRDTVYDMLKMTRKSEEICALKEIPILKHGFPIGHFLGKTSPYKEMFRYLYVTIREPGISWKLRHNYTYTRRCLEASDNMGQKLGLNDVFTAFMILVAGSVFSVTFLTVEKLFRVGTSFTYMR